MDGQFLCSNLMEKSRSWPSAHDWKSCIPQKGIEGSNPSFSATKDLIVKAMRSFELYIPDQTFEVLRLVGCILQGGAVWYE